MNAVFSRLETRFIGIAGFVLDRSGHVRNQVPQVYIPCGYRCTVIIEIALAPAYPFQVSSKQPRVFHVCSQVSQPVTVTPQHL